MENKILNLKSYLLDRYVDEFNWRSIFHYVAAVFQF